MTVKIGDHVTYIDPTRKERRALVTSVWEYESGKTMRSANLVVIADDENQTDNYGRKIERYTSVPHTDNQAAPGNHWHE